MFRAWRDQPLGRKITLMIVITSGLALLLATIGFAALDWRSSQVALFKQLKVEASIIASNSVSALLFQDDISATTTLSALENDREILSAVVYDSNSQPFSVYQRRVNPELLKLPTKNQGLIAGNVFVVLPIQFDGEIIGKIFVVSEPIQWRKIQLQRTYAVLVVFLLTLIIVWIITRRLQIHITNPILQLANTSRKVSETEDYGLRAEKLSDDEIGGLVSDFNEMLFQIQRRDGELRSAQLELEEKVEERTVELKELANKLEHMAYHDALTGLSNRITFDEQLTLALAEARRHKTQIAVLFLDLDRFKVINDTLGHAIGDKLLVNVSKRLSSILREDDILARLGGDEFAVLLKEASPKACAEVADKLINTINAPLNIDGYNLHLTTSIGISLFPNDGINADTILKHADTAMYRSKDSGRNQFAFFSSDMNVRAVRRLQLEHKLRKAVVEKAFYLCYQSKWNTQSLELDGVEVLIRWNDPEEGEISPTEFIPLAEECGLVGEIDKWVLQTACKEVAQIDEVNGEIPSLSVNFSPAHFVRKDIGEEVDRVLRETGFPGEKLELEITESLIGSEQIDIYHLLTKLRELNVRIAIDDFGKAYSSLTRLKQFPINTLKIDRSFILDVGKDPDDEVIIKTIIQMAHNLNLKVVAEGVETEQQYQFVKQNQCDIVQGFLFGKPMPIEEIKKMISSKQSIE